MTNTRLVQRSFSIGYSNLLRLTEMSKVDHRICQAFQGIMQFASAFKAQQQSLEFIFPCEYTLDRLKTLFENERIKDAFGPGLVLLAIANIFWDVGNHAVIENHFPISFPILRTIQAHNAAFETEADSAREGNRFGQYITEKR